MPLTIPPFAQYNAPLNPLRGLWNAKPAEGDKFVSAEIDWLVSPPSNAVQFQLSGNSPVAMSQIVALVVDNGRSGSDVSFVFPDTGFELVVAARNQGIYPVFTNALMFYAVALNAVNGDITIIQVCNSMPPPMPIPASVAQNHASVTAVPAATNGTTQVVAPPTNGTLNAFSLSGDLTTGASPGSVYVAITDGAGHTLWTNVYAVPASSTFNIDINPTNLALRFINGLNFVVSGSTNITGGQFVFNAYYSTP